VEKGKGAPTPRYPMKTGSPNKQEKVLSFLNRKEASTAKNILLKKTRRLEKNRTQPSLEKKTRIGKKTRVGGKGRKDLSPSEKSCSEGEGKKSQSCPREMGASKESPERVHKGGSVEGAVEVWEKGWKKKKKGGRIVKVSGGGERRLLIEGSFLGLDSTRKRNFC